MGATKYRQVWNLDSLFQGGSKSSQLHEHIGYLEQEISEFEEKANSFNIPQKINESINIAVLVEYIGDIRTNISQANSFITCLLAQSPKDQEAMILQGIITTINTRFESALKKVKNTLVKIDYHLWQGLLNTDVLANFKFILTEWRKDGEMTLSDREQNLVSDLMVDGYHAWGQFYNSFINNFTIKVQINGEQKNLSVG